VTRALFIGAAVLFGWGFIEVAGRAGGAVVATGWTLLTVAGLAWWASTKRDGIGRPAGLEGLMRPPERWWPVVGAAAAMVLVGQSMYALYGMSVIAPESPSSLATAGSTAQMLQVATAMIFFNPLIEELVFRGWVQSGLGRALGAKAAILTSSLLFALFHGEPLRLPYYFALGMVLGIAVYRTRSIWTGVVMHTVYNVVVVLRETTEPLSSAIDGFSRFAGPGGLIALLLLASAMLGSLWRAAGDRSLAACAPACGELRAVA